MAGRLITGKQLRRLHTLWGLLAKQEGFDRKDRAARIAWFNGNVLTKEKEIDGVEWELHSFKELSLECAARAIERLQELLPPEIVTRKKRRRGPAPPASGEQLARIAELQGALAMSAEQFDQWLRSYHGPLRGRTAIRTTFDAGRVIRALESMARRRKPLTAEAAEVHA